jgi:beta-fructofuranosidase
LIDGKGRQIMWSWIFDDRPDSLKTYYGYTGVYGLPRTLWLGPDGALRMAPVPELQALRQNEKSRKVLVVKDGSPLTLEGFGSDMLELEITIQPGTATQYGVKVGVSDDGREETSLYYDAAQKTLVCDATRSSLDIGRRNIESAPLPLVKGEQLVLRVFVDRGIVEVFANNKQAIGRSIYPVLKGRGVHLFANGGDAKIVSVKAWELMPTNPY